jgi:hypothetical protein
MFYACEFRAREVCICVHVGLAAGNHCKACEWVKKRANISAESSREQKLASLSKSFHRVLLSAACLDGRAAELSEGDLTLFELW